MLWPQLLLLLVWKMFLNYLLYLGKSSVIYQELVHNETMSHSYLSMSTVSFRRKAACPATVFTKDMSKTHQISYKCLLVPALFSIVENLHDMP